MLGVRIKGKGILQKGGCHAPWRTHGGTEKHVAYRTLHKVVGMIGAKAPWGKGRRSSGPGVLNQGV